MINRLHPSRSDLEILMATLDVNVVILSECTVSPGWRLSFPPADMAGIHYDLGGTGQMVVNGGPPITIAPHTMVIAPPRQPLRFDVAIDESSPRPPKVLEAELRTDATARVQRFAAGSAEPMMILICGYFRACYGASLDLFQALPFPIVERFDPADDIDNKLNAALAEIRAHQVGVGAMTTALLKQVLVMVLRRSLSSTDLWIRRCPALGDPRIARAFADMLAHPGTQHSILTLSHTACLSRSAFVARFDRAFGRSPMAVLRQLRMHHAADLLDTNLLSIEQVAHAVGYTSRSSFFRAFRQIHGQDPAARRKGARRAR